MKLYRNKMTGEVRNYVGWRAWADIFYASLVYDEMGRDVATIKTLDKFRPDDWWERIQKTLRLEELE